MWWSCQGILIENLFIPMKDSFFDFHKKIFKNLMGQLFSMEKITRRITIKDTDILLTCDTDNGIKIAREAILEARKFIEDYIGNYPDFKHSFDPLEPEKDAPEIIREMCKAGEIAGVGPMASVAGTIAQFVGRRLVESGEKNVIVENGGDIYISGDREIVIGIFSGESSPFSKKLGLKITPDLLPLGICTSSGTVGHSISLGNADAVIILASSTPNADAVATAAANLVDTRDEKGVQKALDFVKGINKISGAIIIAGDIIATWGNLPEIIKTREFDYMDG